MLKQKKFFSSGALLICLLLAVLIHPSDDPRAQQPRQINEGFAMIFSGANDPNINRVVYGKPFTSTETRGPLGTEESDPVFKRRNSFAAETNVEFVTKPFVMPDARLRLNIDVLHGAAALTRGSYVMVEMLDEQGQVIPGYEREKSLAADINELDHLISWFGNNTATVKSLVGKTVSLRILLRDARLYSVHTRVHEKKPLEKLLLTVKNATLEPWETSYFHLRGESKDGRVVALDHQPVAYIVSEPDLIIAKSEKRDIHRGHLTVYRETDSRRKATFQAAVTVGNREVRSNPVTLDIKPLSKIFKSSDFKLLFMQQSDVFDVQGAITFKPNRLEYYADTRGLPTTPKAMTLYNRRIGDKYYVWGSSRGTLGKAFRGVTTDGINFTTEPVTTTMAPNNFLDMTYNALKNEYLAFERVPNPPRWDVHKSSDGLTFTRVGTAYQDFDGIKPLWDAKNNQYTAFQLTYQETAEPRQYPDNLGVASRAGNRVRRIFTRRTSPDGLNWTPNNKVEQADPKTWTDPLYYAIVPDEQDPPDLECYWLDVFPYGDRYLGMLMTYAVAPPRFLALFPYDQYPSQHGPHVKTEWIISSDLKTWERPFRDAKATEDLRLYFMHAPLELHDRMLFLVSNQNYDYAPEHGARPGQNNEVYSLPADRFISAGGSDGASFTTKAFTVPKDALHINAEGSVSIEVLDADNKVIPGFESGKNVLTNIDELHRKLVWKNADSTGLAGRTVRLRFNFNRPGRVYSIHTYK